MDKKLTLGKADLLRLRLDGLTYKSIAEKANVSRQRIQEILSPPPKVRRFIVTKFNGRCCMCGIQVGKSGHVHHSSNNGIEHYEDMDNLELLCISCHRRAHSNTMQAYCKHCGKPTKRGNPFCNRKCQHNYSTLTLICTYCGKAFTRPRGASDKQKRSSKSGLVFCSHRCVAKYTKFGQGDSTKQNLKDRLLSLIGKKRSKI